MSDFDPKKRDLDIALALARGDTIAEVAKACGVSPKTVSRRRADPAFASFVRGLRAEMRSQACGLASSISRDAVASLQTLLQSEDERVVLGAARALLEHTPKLAETVDLADELQQLKDQLVAAGVQLP